MGMAWSGPSIFVQHMVAFTFSLSQLLCTRCLFVRDDYTAFNLVCKAASLGSGRDTFKEYKDMAEAGNADLQLFFALAHMNGDGLEKDPKEAFRWLSLAAAQDHDRALILSGDPNVPAA